jgi:hypothetical protein
MSATAELTTVQAAALAGIPYASLYARLYDEGLPLALPRVEGRRDMPHYSRCQALALRVARRLRRMGAATGEVRRIVELFWPLTESALEGQFRAGRTCLVVTGPNVSPALQSEAGTQDGLVTSHTVARQQGIMVGFLDVAQEWRLMNQALAELN